MLQDSATDPTSGPELLARDVPHPDPRSHNIHVGYGQEEKTRTAEIDRTIRGFHYD